MGFSKGLLARVVSILGKETLHAAVDMAVDIVGDAIE